MCFIQSVADVTFSISCIRYSISCVFYSISCTCDFSISCVFFINCACDLLDQSSLIIDIRSVVCFSQSIEHETFSFICAWHSIVCTVGPGHRI